MEGNQRAVIGYDDSPYLKDVEIKRQNDKIFLPYKALMEKSLC